MLKAFLLRNLCPKEKNLELVLKNEEKFISCINISDIYLVELAKARISF
jgi:hypothetical protein